MNDREEFYLQLIQEVKLAFQRYKKMSQQRDRTLREIRNFLGDMPPKMAEHIQYLMELDTEAEQYVREDYNPGTMILWQRLKRDHNWRGYWVNACGLDVDLYCNYILAGIKYSQDRNGRTLTQWFHDNYPTVKPIPQSIKLANEDFNKFFNK